MSRMARIAGVVAIGLGIYGVLGVVCYFALKGAGVEPSEWGIGFYCGLALAGLQDNARDEWRSA